MNTSEKHCGWQLDQKSREELDRFMHEALQSANLQRDICYSVLYMFQQGILLENPAISLPDLFRKSCTAVLIPAGYETWGSYVYEHDERYSNEAREWAMCQTCSFFLFIQYTAIVYLGYHTLPDSMQCLEIMKYLFPVNPCRHYWFSAGIKEPVSPRINGISPSIRSAVEKEDVVHLKLQCDISKDPEITLKRIYYLLFRTEKPFLALELHSLSGGLNKLVDRQYLKDYWMYYLVEWDGECKAHLTKEDIGKLQFSLFMYQHFDDLWYLLVKQPFSCEPTVIEALANQKLPLDTPCSRRYETFTVRQFIRLWDDFGKYLNYPNVDALVEIFRKNNLPQNQDEC